MHADLYAFLQIAVQLGLAFLEILFAGLKGLAGSLIELVPQDIVLYGVTKFLPFVLQCFDCFGFFCGVLGALNECLHLRDQVFLFLCGREVLPVDQLADARLEGREQLVQGLL